MTVDQETKTCRWRPYAWHETYTAHPEQNQTWTSLESRNSRQHQELGFYYHYYQYTFIYKFNIQYIYIIHTYDFIEENVHFPRLAERHEEIPDPNVLRTSVGHVGHL